MKNIFVISLLTIALTAFAAWPQTNNNSGAKVSIRMTSFDYGYVPAGEIVSHSYYLRNTGTDTLKILKVQPGCGCTKAPMKKEVATAGDSADIELVFTASTSAHGKFSKSAAVTCNASDRPTLQLEFSGVVYDHTTNLQPLSLSTPSITLNDQAKINETELTVKNVSKTPIKMRLISYPEGYLRVSVPESEIKPGQAGEIRVKLDKSVSESQFNKSFTFEVNDSAQTRYSIPVVLTNVTNMTPNLGAGGTH